MEILELTLKLRDRLIDYRYSRKGHVVSNHINAIDILVSLVEYGIKDKRPISLDEQRWLDASYYVDYVLGGSEWEDLSDMYSQLVEKVRNHNYFR